MRRSSAHQTWEGPHVTQTTDTAAPSAEATASGRGKQGLDKMLLSDLKSLAGTLGIKGITGMRKSALVDAITSAQSGRSDSGNRSASTRSSQSSARTSDRQRDRTSAPASEPSGNGDVPAADH